MTEDKIKALNAIKQIIPTSGTLTYGYGKVLIEMSGNCNVVEIRYSGKIEAIASFMPNRTFVRMNKNKIIIGQKALWNPSPYKNNILWP